MTERDHPLDGARPAEMDPVYQPGMVEERRYREWESRGDFHALPVRDRDPYCIVIPPPNITGSLHMGHALDNTIQDCLIRWKRMEGMNAMWLPGTDHAGIATQMVVERVLAKEGTSRHQLGREKFLERVWRWKDEYGGIIVDQLKKLGCSCDWDRLRFTMDEGYSRAVREVFARLFQKGLIYRDYYIINWCPRCRTAISDLEVEHEEDPNGKLYYVRYPIEGGDPRAGEGIVVATTRPETILADVAVAVHPDDPRYNGWIGKRVVVPVAGRPVPVIPDEVVDPEFGTGALKITPGHDLNDFQVGRRHDLPPLVVIDLQGKMNEHAARFSHGRIPNGTDRFEARAMMETLLAEGGWLVKPPESYALPLARCARCATPLEPSYSLQWFMKMKDLALPAIRVVEEGKVRFIPERFKGIYLHWMEQIRDWCISRQLWWGHRIPVWYCARCNEGKIMEGRIELGATPIVSVDPPATCPDCGGADLIQDPDVLDTWFSSALWPFATLGWPEKPPDLDVFYPTSVLVTGRDILFLWVARMIMMGLEFMGEVPFSEVHVHATILDKEGRRMSKSKGTGVDPLDLIAKYGADATRFGILFQTAQGQDVRFSAEKIEMARNFGNKVWNAARLVLRLTAADPAFRLPASTPLSLPDAWIRLRLAETVRDVTGAYRNYAFSEAARLLYEFFWGEFCDWYLEIAKVVLGEGEETRSPVVRGLLWEGLATTLKLLHPLMPFLTEEIWRTVSPGNGTIMREGWPRANEGLLAAQVAGQSPTVEQRMGFFMDVVRAIRNLRAEVSISPKQLVPVAIECMEGWQEEILRRYSLELRSLARVSEFLHHDSFHAVGTGSAPIVKALTARVEGTALFLPLEGVVDLDLEVGRLRKELEQIAADLDAVMARLTPEFRSKAKPEVVAREEARRKELLDKRDRLTHRLSLLA